MFNGGNFAAILLYFAIVIDCKQFRYDYDFYQEADGWLKIHVIPAEWKDARYRCNREGGVLASPENENLWSAMKRIVKNLRKQYSRGVFTGTHATYSRGYYHSIEGVPRDKAFDCLEYKNFNSWYGTCPTDDDGRSKLRTPLSRMPVRWAPGEPDNHGGIEDCLIMLPNGTFADMDCTRLYPYICYKKRTSDLALTNCGTVDKSYVLDRRTGNCYKFHPEPQVWGRAFATCSSEGGHLAIINGVTEADILKEILALHPPEKQPGYFSKNVTHIGNSDWGVRGLWRTIHGDTLEEAGYNVWAQGQPDNDNGQYCGSIFNDSKLDDNWCHAPCPFICEKKTDSLLIDGEL